MKKVFLAPVALIGWFVAIILWVVWNVSDAIALYKWRKS